MRHNPNPGNRKESESCKSGPSVVTPSNTSSALDYLTRKKLYNGEDHTFSGVQNGITSIDARSEGWDAQPWPFTAVERLTVNPVIQRIRGDWGDREISKMVVVERKEHGPGPIPIANVTCHFASCVWLCSDPHIRPRANKSPGVFRIAGSREEANRVRGV